MTAPCFVDANVLVYAHDPSEPLKRKLAAELLGRLWAGSNGRTSVQVLNEFYTVLTRKVRIRRSAEETWAEVEEFFRWSPQQLNVELLRRARQVEARHRLDWWDCLIVAAAQLQGCSLLYTEDLQHGATLDGVRVVNPFISQVQEVAAQYRVPVSSPHRPRGRPRKQATA